MYLQFNLLFLITKVALDLFFGMMGTGNGCSFVVYRNDAFDYVKSIRPCVESEYIVNYDEDNIHKEKWSIL